MEAYIYLAGTMVERVVLPSVEVLMVSNYCSVMVMSNMLLAGNARESKSKSLRGIHCQADYPRKDSDVFGSTHACGVHINLYAADALAYHPLSIPHLQYRAMLMTGGMTMLEHCCLHSA